MKRLTTSALIAMIGVTLVSQSANAGNSKTNYTADDLLFGFRQTAGPGATQDYILDLGQALHTISIGALRLRAPEPPVTEVLALT